MKLHNIFSSKVSAPSLIGRVGVGLFLGTMFVSCSDVDLLDGPYRETISNLKYEITEGSRKVVLSWLNPTVGNQSGIQIIKDDTDVLVDDDNVTDNYTIKKAPANVDVAYTVKARYNDGTVSEGQTVRFFLPWEGGKGGNMIAMLVPNDYEQSADEKDAVAWFEETYVAAGNGVVVTPATIEELDTEKQAACWVMCDRIGLDKGYDKLPGGLASGETILALKEFTTGGGNLFLTNHATQLTVALGRIPEAYAPGIYGNGEGGDNPDIWGSQPIIGNAEGQIYDHSAHPIYAGMDFTAGLYERSIYKFEGAGFKGDHNCMWDLNAYGLPAEPNVVKAWEDATNSTVLGTWNHVVDYCCAGIVDFAPTTECPGRILAVGLAAYEWNEGDRHPEKDQLEMFTANCLKYVSTTSKKVAMLVPNDYENSADEKDAVAWFNANYVANGTGVLVTPATIEQLDIDENPVCWVMCDRIGLEKGYQNLPGGLVSGEVIGALKEYANEGGNLLLTNHATQLTVAIERIPEAYAPGIYGNGEGGDNPDIWGSQPIIGNAEGQIYDHSKHPIYWGMNFTAGLYERSIYKFEGAGFKGDHNCMWDLNAYGLPAEPNVVKAWEDATNSTVLGTWNHVVDYCCAGIVEFAPTTTCKGCIIAVGLAAYEWNEGDTHPEKDQLERFTANCINYLK